MIGRVAKIITLVNLPITSGVFDTKDIWWKWSLSVRGCANIIWLYVTQTGGTWLPCSCTTGTLAVEWNRAETSCISSIIIVSQLNPSREDLVFFLMTYNTEGHSTAHLFFSNNWYFRHDFTLCNSRIALEISTGISVCKGTHGFLVSSFFNGVFACFCRDQMKGKKEHFKKVRSFLLTY